MYSSRVMLLAGANFVIATVWLMGSRNITAPNTVNNNLKLTNNCAASANTDKTPPTNPVSVQDCEVDNGRLLATAIGLTLLIFVRDTSWIA
mmetsp:Transcript_17670/g.28927  ORF Transcript_17670/g.28927 Transcript_17670/m.28927 type:complete len:91 (-) Transcript_17670:35-307(-)